MRIIEKIPIGFNIVFRSMGYLTSPLKSRIRIGHETRIKPSATKIKSLGRK
jgi:hypothetical protein